MHHKRTNILSRIHGHRESSEFWMYTSSTPCTVVLGLLANLFELSEFSSSLPAHTFSRKLTLDWWGMYFLAAPAGFFLWIEIWRASCCLLSSSALHCSIWGLEGANIFKQSSSSWELPAVLRLTSCTLKALDDSKDASIPMSTCGKVGSLDEFSTKTLTMIWYSWRVH